MVNREYYQHVVMMGKSPFIAFPYNDVIRCMNDRLMLADMFEILTHPDREQWNLYVAEKSAAKCAHLFDWGEGIARAYTLPLFRLAVVRSKAHRISGILSLVLFSPPGKETRLISLPYTDAAGILADDWESGQRLLQAALKLADRLGANHLELRQGGALGTVFQEQKNNETWSYRVHTFKTGLIRAVPESVGTLWSTLAAKVRNQIRKARRCGCTVRTGGIELLPDFYAVFSENMRDLGSPVHGMELFRNLMRSTSIQTAIICITLNGKPAAASLVIRHNETLYNPWASSLRRYRPLCPNMLLYWSMLEYTVLHHCRWFDFGRSTPNAPTHRFKMQWGAEMEPLGWHVFSRKPHMWNPADESLEYESWKSKDLTSSRMEGPALRKWISL